VQCDIIKLDTRGKTQRREYPLASSNVDNPSDTGAVNLNGLLILLVEDSWHVGIAMERLLRTCGADVIGPAPTTADAERLICDRAPDVALVDINLRGGERAYDMIDRLHDRGIRVVVMSGYGDVPLAPGRAAAILQKPVNDAELLATLLPVTANKLDR
jgi:CheY-like chemotaxis protein